VEISIQTVIAAALALIETAAPLFQNNAQITQVIATLETWVPIVEQGATDLVQPIKNVIAALQNNGNVTADQIAALQALDAKVDAAFDAADAAWQAANPDPNT
jgi:hypothetical protein